MAKEKLKHPGFFEHLTDLVLYDDVYRWVGLLIVIGVGAIVGSVAALSNDDPQGDVVVATGISMLITAICLLGFYSLFIERLQKRTLDKIYMAKEIPILEPSKPLSRRPPATSDLIMAMRRRSPSKGLKSKTPYLKLMAATGAICSLAIIFGVLSYRYETHTLAEEFGRAIEAHDYDRVASITEQAETVSEHLHAAMTQKFIQTLTRAAADLPPQKPDIKQPSNIKQPNEKQVKALAGALTEVAKRNPALPGPWRAIATLASYNTSEIAGTAQLPDCDITQAPHTIDPSELPFRVPLASPSSGYVFKNCTLHMDHLPPGKLQTGMAYLQADPNRSLPPWISGSLALIFNCNVILTDSGIAETGILVFRAFNSRFEFHIEKTPSPPAQNLLLASVGAPVPGDFSLQLPRNSHETP